MAAKWLQWVYLLLLQGAPPRRWIVAESAWGEVADAGEVAGEVVDVEVVGVGVGGDDEGDDDRCC